MTKITVKQDENKPVLVEVMAEAIVAISEGIKKLRSGPLNDRALILLIQNAAPNHGGAGGRNPLTKREERA